MLISVVFSGENPSVTNWKFAGRLSRWHSKNRALRSTLRETISSFAWVCVDFCCFFRGRSQCYRIENLPVDQVADTFKTERLTTPLGRSCWILLGFMLISVVLQGKILVLPNIIFAGRLSRWHVHNRALHSTLRQKLLNFAWVCADFCCFSGENPSVTELNICRAIKSPTR